MPKVAGVAFQNWRVRLLQADRWKESEAEQTEVWSHCADLLHRYERSCDVVRVS